MEIVTIVTSHPVLKISILVNISQLYIQGAFLSKEIVF